MVLPFLPLIGAAISGVGSIIGGAMQANAANDAANRNTGLANAYKDEGMGYIGQGTNKAGGYLQQISDQYAPFASMYSNAMGLNGATGSDAARAAFTESPGYQFNLDRGLQATDRAASRSGLLDSGNLFAALQDRGAGLASQEWNGWMDRLGSGATNNATALGNQANLWSNDAGQRVDLLSGVTSALMGANNQRAAGGQAMGQSVGNALGGLGGIFGGYGGFK